MEDNSFFQNAIAIDLETTFDLWNKPQVISIADPTAEEKIRVLESAQNIPGISGKLWVGHNLAYFDMPILQELGYEPEAIWDTWLAEQILSAGNSSHDFSYADLVKKYFNVEISKELQKSDWTWPITPEQEEYCKADVRYLLGIARRQYEAMAQLGMLPHTILLFDTAKVWFRDVWNGYPMDVTKREQLQYECDIESKKLMIRLLKEVPVKFFTKANFTLKALQAFLDKIEPYNTVIGKPESKKDFANFDWEQVRDYLMVTGDFNPDIFVKPSSHIFAGKVAEHHGVSLESYDAKHLEEYMESGECLPFKEIMSIVMEMRKVDKIRGTYANDNPELIGTHQDGSLRIKPKFTMTATGRLTFSPHAQIPRPDEDDEDGSSMRNKLQALYIPPKGYITLALDYGSMESVAAGIFYRDVFKLHSVREGFDPYLLLASKVFGFDYSDVTQTKQLKKEKKALRQAVKAVELARNFGAGVWKLNDMMKIICEKNGLPSVSGQQVVDAWNSLYPQLADAFDGIKGELVGGLEHYAKSYSPNTKQQSPNTISQLKESEAMAHISNTFGLQRIEPLYKICNWVRTPQYINHPIQSSCSTVTLLAVNAVKKLYPSIIIPTTIHDSLICFVPEAGINDLSLEDIKTGVTELMIYAFWIVFGSSIKVDAGYSYSGLKGE